MRPLPTLSAIVLLGLCLAGPAGAFGHEANLPQVAQDLNARALHVLVFHPYPDPQGDPWGVPYAEANGTSVDYMRATYQVHTFPTGVFDGVDAMAGATQFMLTYRAYESALVNRHAVDAPLRLGLIGEREGPMALLHVHVSAKSVLDSAAADLHVVLFEDELEFNGGNGVDLHRFTVRTILDPVRVTLDEQGVFTHTAAARLDPSWDPGQVGFVAYVVNRDAASRSHQAGEVLQATTYLLSQEGQTVQHSRGVLLEYWSATWCPTCLWGDAALDELANTYGIRSSRTMQDGYLRPFAVGPVAAGLFLAVTVVLVTPRVRDPPGGPGGGSA